MELVFALLIIGLVGFIWWIVTPSDDPPVPTLLNPVYPPPGAPKHDTASHTASSTEYYGPHRAPFAYVESLMNAPEVKEKAPVSSCSARERITEMRLKALETGQPIDTMALVRDAYNTMVEAVHPSPFDSTYKREYEQVREQRDTARALLLFAIDRDNEARSATTQTETP